MSVLTIRQILKRHYPPEINNWRIYILSSGFVSLFTLIFQPFGLVHFQSEYKLLILAGYGIVVLSVLFFIPYVLKLLFSSWFLNDSWTVLKQTMLTFFVVVVISLCLFLYSSFFEVIDPFGWEACIRFLWKAVAVSIFPILGTTLVAQIIKLKNGDEELSDLISSDVEKDDVPGISSIISYNGAHEIKIDTTSIAYIESVGNYVKIGHYERGELVISLLRNTLKSIADQLQHLPFFLRVHRSFLINISHIEKTAGRSQRLRLLIKKSEIEIPVSRNLVKKVRQVLELD